MAHTRQSRPDYGLHFQLKALFKLFPPRSDAVSLYERFGSEVGSHLWLIDFVYHSTLGLRVIKKKRRFGGTLDASAAMLIDPTGVPRL